jgi:hypothetical protein
MGGHGMNRVVISHIRSLLLIDRIHPVCLDRACLKIAKGSRILLWAGLTLGAIWLTGCVKPVEVSGVVILYTSVPEKIINEIEAAFEKQHPTVDLQVYRAGTSKVMARVEEELEAGSRWKAKREKAAPSQSSCP